MKPRSDCEAESSVSAPEQTVCQDRIHQKYVIPYSFESRSNRLVAFEGDGGSIVSRKGMLLRSILRTIEVGKTRVKTDLIIF